MKQNILLIFFILFNSVMHAQILDGIYLDGAYVPQIPQIYQTTFINPNWKDSLFLKQDAVKNDLKKLPSFPDCIWVNKKTSSISNSQALYAYYTDSGKYKMDTTMNLSIYTHLDLSEYSSSFYFRKFEVTNKEYREFTNWVRDSIARTYLAESGIEGYREEWYDSDGDEHRKLNWKKKIEWDSEDPDYRMALADMYLPEEERFYRRKELDTRKFIYYYTYYVEGLRYKTRVQVYPDTLVWIKDHEVSDMEPMTQLYFWNEKYDDYPAVGISWNQAKAYLHWKEQRINESLQKKYPGMEVKLELPSLVEWELTNSQMNDRPNNFYNPWLCNLITGNENKLKERLVVLVDSQSVKVEPVVYTYSNHGVYAPDYYQDGYYIKENTPRAKYIKWIEHDTTLFINGDEYKITTKKWIYEVDHLTSFYNPLPWFGSMNHSSRVMYAYPVTSPANLLTLKDKEEITVPSFNIENSYTIQTTHLKGKYLYNEVSFMEGNVSEWMLNDYENWYPGFQAHMLQLEKKESIDAELEYNLEMLGNYWNAKNGKLIKGSNWYHDACTQGETIDANVQRFADPDSSFSTVGFRYVIHIKTFPKK